MYGDITYMRSSNLFTSVFDEEMKSRGFRRKGHLYYRLVGEIMQGVVLKAINPYSICFHAMPYWAYYDSIVDKNGYWAEWGMEIDPSSLFGGYYRKENLAINTDAMKVCLNLAKEIFLPIIESVTDMDSYIQYKSHVWDEPETKFNPYLRKIYIPEFAEKYSEEVDRRVIQPFVRLFYARPTGADQYVYLYKAFLENDFTNAYQEMRKNAECILSNSGVEKNLFGEFEEIMQRQDFKWIESFRASRIHEMIPILKRSFGIEIQNPPQLKESLKQLKKPSWFFAYDRDEICEIEIVNVSSIPNSNIECDYERIVLIQDTSEFLQKFGFIKHTRVINKGKMKSKTHGNDHQNGIKVSYKSGDYEILLRDCRCVYMKGLGVCLNNVSGIEFDNDEFHSIIEEVIAQNK